MKTLFFVILLLITTLNCPQTVTFVPEDQLTYIFSINYADSTCSGFQFTGCRGLMVGGQEQQWSDWGECYKRACGGLRTPDYLNTLALQECQEKLTENRKLKDLVFLRKILIFSTASLPLLLILVCMIRLLAPKLIRRIQACLTGKPVSESKEKQEVRPSIVEDLRWHQNINKKVEGEEVSSAQRESTCTFEQEQCPICLEPKCNLQLPCAHRFHISCVRESYKFDNRCSICRRDIEGLYKVYCPCNQRFMNVSTLEQDRICPTCYTP